MTWSHPRAPLPSCVVAALVADPDADVADDDVVRVRAAEGVVLEADAVARRGLPGDREVRVADDELRLQRDHPADAEHDRPRAARLDRLPQAAGAGVVQVRHLVHLARRGRRWRTGRSPRPRGTRGAARGTATPRRERRRRRGPCPPARSTAAGGRASGPRWRSVASFVSPRNSGDCASLATSRRRCRGRRGARSPRRRPATPTPGLPGRVRRRRPASGFAARRPGRSGRSRSR